MTNIRFGILDRYVVFELARVFAVILIVLIAVLVSILLLQTLERVSVGSLNPDLVLRWLWYDILDDSSLLLPPAYFIGALIALGRIARDSELIAMHAAGIGPQRFYRALVFFAIPLALFTGWMALFVKPYAVAQLHQIKATQATQESQAMAVQAGRFYQLEGDGLTFYARTLNKEGGFSEVFLLDRRDGETKVLLGERAQIQAATSNAMTPLPSSILIDQGQRFDGNAGSQDFRLSRFDRYTYFVQSPEASSRQSDARAAKSSIALLSSGDPGDHAELTNRLASPIAILTLSLLILPLTQLSPRQGNGARIFLAFLAYVAFLTLQQVAQTGVERGQTPIWFGLLWYQILIVAAVYLALVPDSLWWRRLARTQGRATS